MELYKKLFIQAGILPDAVGDPKCLDDVLQQSTIAPADLESAVSRVIALLEEVNAEFNGDTERVAGKMDGLPRNYVAAIQQMLWRMSTRLVTEDVPEVASALLLYLWRLQTGWLAVLDGDIPNIAEHVRDSEFATF